MVILAEIHHRKSFSLCCGMAKLTLNAGCIRAAEVKAPFLLMTLNCSDRKEKKYYGS